MSIQLPLAVAAWWCVIVSGLAGCDDAPGASGPASGEVRLTEGGPVCAAPLVASESVDLVEGDVRTVPEGRVGADSGTTDLPVFELRQPLQGATVELRGRGSSKILARTETDARGRWCLQKPAEVPFGGSLRVVVDDGATIRLRAPVVRARGTTLSERSEAFVQWLDARDGDDLSRAAILNLEAVVFTESTLFTPVRPPVESRRELVEELRAKIRSSERVAEIVEKGQ